jgi:hypothetical protein
MTYELAYLRAVMEWLERSGKYEPLDFEEIYEDWKENIIQGKPSTLRSPQGSWDFVAPPVEEVQ